ncbi:MAG: FHA domain-containing protein [Acidimicrobiia bacterium]|nr:FHA domain-containing protein [Acidimicrobiia bacterium]
MPILAVNIVKVLFVVALYGFLLYVARAMRGQAVGPPTEAAPTPTSATRRRRPDEPTPPPPARQLALEIVPPDGVPRQVALTGRIVIGRGEGADIRIDDEFSSERHAAFEPRRGAVWVEDLGSTNGTTLDGARITAPTRLDPGATVVVGQTRVTVR